MTRHEDALRRALAEGFRLIAHRVASQIAAELHADKAAYLTTAAHGIDAERAPQPVPSVSTWR
jgi:hypothetical protein